MNKNVFEFGQIKMDFWIMNYLSTNSIRLLCSIFLIFLTNGPSFSQAIVWPGDANNNGICNHYDVLNLGIGHNATGSTRDSTDISWLGQSPNSLWGINFLNGPDYSYGDCNGNGIIDSLDVSAIHQNFGLTHGSVIADSFSSGGPALPSLSFNFPLDSTSSSSTISVSTALGSGPISIDSIYGIAYTIEYDTHLVASITIDFSGSLFHGGGGNPIGFFKDLRSEQKFVVSIVRTNHVNINGSGSGGSVIIVMEDNLKTQIAPGMLQLNITDLLAMDRLGNVMPFSTMSDSIYVFQGRGNELSDAGISLFPNPSRDVFHLRSENGGMKSIEIFEVSGRKWKEFQIENPYSADINIEEFPAGLYFVKVFAFGRSFSGKILTLN